MTKQQLEVLTVVELKAIAKENGLKGYSKLRKAELVEMLVSHEMEQAAEATEKQEFIELLEQSNNIVYTKITHVSHSGMMRVVETYIKTDKGIQNITHNVQKYTQNTIYHGGGLKVHGAGFNAGFDVVYRLGLALYGNGYVLSQRAL